MVNGVAVVTESNRAAVVVAVADVVGVACVDVVGVVVC